MTDERVDGPIIDYTISVGEEALGRWSDDNKSVSKIAKDINGAIKFKGAASTAIKLAEYTVPELTISSDAVRQRYHAMNASGLPFLYKTMRLLSPCKTSIYAF